MDEDERKLSTFERTLGTYSVAGAICSDGDVIDFVDGERKGIIIADTRGHVKERGDKAREFLKKEIENGWGSLRDAYTEILDLGKRLMVAGHGKPYFKWSMNHGWWDSIEFCYANLNKEEVELTGLRHLIIRENGVVDQFNTTLSPYYFEEPGDRKTIKTKLNIGDVYLMSSDGLAGNTKHTLYQDSKEGKISLDCKNISSEFIFSKYIDCINKNKNLPVEGLRDAIVNELQKYFLPRNERYDDVTFVVVKRT